MLNAVDPVFNVPIFDAALEAGVTYLDMAMTLSEPHPTNPYSEVGVKLGDYQFERAAGGSNGACSRSSGSASSRAPPTSSPAMPRTSSSRPSTRWGSATASNLVVEGYDFAPTFSIWTTIEECLNPPVIWERERGWFTTEPFSEPEVFDFPEGIGPVECVNIEHEEVLLVPRWIDCERVTFKYGLGDEFIGVLKTLHKLGLDAKEKIPVKGVEVAPRDVVAAALPDPMTLGDRMTGKTCAGTLVTGLGKDGQPRKTYLYHVVDNAWSMAEYGSQAVVWQTALNPVVALELLAEGTWSGTGVLGPEAFPPQPYLDKLAELGSPHGVLELEPLDDRAGAPGEAPARPAAVAFCRARSAEASQRAPPVQAASPPARSAVQTTTHRRRLPLPTDTIAAARSFMSPRLSPAAFMFAHAPPRARSRG